MHEFTDNEVTCLFYAARGGDEPMINDTQRTAVLVLGELAREGNPDAGKALDQLYRAPSIHPLLREMIEVNRISMG